VLQRIGREVRIAAGSSWNQTQLHERSRPPHNLARSNLQARFGVIAKARGVSESALLRHLVESTLTATDTVHASTPDPVLPAASSGRISVRLRTDDLLFLRERERGGTANQHLWLSACRAHLRAQVRFDGGTGSP